MPVRSSRKVKVWLRPSERAPCQASDGRRTTFYTWSFSVETFVRFPPSSCMCRLAEKDFSVHKKRARYYSCACFSPKSFVLGCLQGRLMSPIVQDLGRRIRGNGAAKRAFGPRQDLLVVVPPPGTFFFFSFFLFVWKSRVMNVDFIFLSITCY